MKKLFSVLAVLFVLGTTTVFAKGTTGIGAQAGWPLGGALTFKVSSLPCVFAVDLGGGKDDLHVGLTADWWIANPVISGPWCYFYGVGVYGGVAIGDDYLHIGVGPRAIIGTNIYLIDGFLEFYLQGGWQPMVWVTDEIGFDWINFPVNLGFRFWF